MDIKWLGHACFLIEDTSGTRLITDPYESGAFGGAIGYGPVRERVDIVTVSHDHLDHGYTDDIIGDFKLIDKCGSFKVGGVKIEGILSWHDGEEGSMRGKNIIYRIEMDGISICHLGDLGHLLDRATVKSLKPIDIALVPIGGKFTINREEAASVISSLDPRIAIPMHYKNEKCRLDIDDIEGFAKSYADILQLPDSTLNVKSESLSDEPKIVILSPAL